MTKTEQARERLKAVLEEMNTISESVETIDAELEAEEAEKFDELNAEQKRLKVNIERWSTTATAEEEANTLPARRSTPNGPSLATMQAASTGVRFGTNVHDTEPPDYSKGPNFEASAFEPPLRLPATPIKRLGTLKAFTGPTGPEEAYAFGQWLGAAFFQNERASQFCRERGIPIHAALSEGINSAGGFFVLPEFATQRLIDLKEEYGVFRRNTNVVQMASDTMSIPRRAGGLTGYFIGENTEVTASDPKWDQVQLVAKKLGVLNKMSSELSDDAVVSMADKVLNEAAYTIAKKEDDCGFIGDGTSTYGGIQGVITKMGAGSYQAMGAGDRAFSDIVVADDVETMLAKLPQYALNSGNCKWYISSTGFAAFMMRILDALGGNTIANLQAGVTKQFLGFPVEITQSLHNVTTDAAINTVMILFGDLAMGTTLGDRRNFRVAISNDRYFEYDQVGILVTTRFDINCHDVGTASAAGPVVGIRSGAS
jgi:HK97 family phage major capsid protein